MADEKQKADDAAEQVFLPKPNVVKFLGHRIELRPVPVAVAKDIRRMIDKLGKIMEEARENGNIAKFLEMDEEAAELYVSTVYRLLQFYKIDIARNEITERASIPELKTFIEMQQEVQTGEDFLFRPLWNIMVVFFPKPQMPMLPQEPSS